jgi:hypothetical protein
MTRKESKQSRILPIPHTIHLFIQGLKPGLLDAILHHDTQPNTMDEWITKAQTEQQKFASRQVMRNPNFMKYQWTNLPPNAMDINTTPTMK